MKLSKRLLAGLLATGMLTTGSTAFAAVTYGDGLTKVGDTDAYTGTGISTSTAVGDPAKHTVTGTANFEDAVSVEITWGALTYSFTRTWDPTNSQWLDAVWSTTAEASKISAENKSAKAYDVNLAFTPATFNASAEETDDDYATDGKIINYTGVNHIFLEKPATKASEAETTGGTNAEQATLALGDKTQDSAARTKASYLWLSGNPKNQKNDAASIAGTFGAGNTETFGTVTATLAEHTGS